MEDWVTIRNLKSKNPGMGTRKIADILGVGFEDMCVLTARATEQKYDGSYEEISRVIKDVIPATKQKESLKIFF